MENRIAEDYVSFETAKLLKEKGFNESIETLIQPDGTRWFLDENSVKIDKHLTIRNSETNPYSDAVSCPTLQMAAKWIRQEYKLHIYVDYECDRGYQPNINNLRTNHLVSMEMYNGFKHEEALEAAIIYSLKNLI